LTSHLPRHYDSGHYIAKELNMTLSELVRSYRAQVEAAEAVRAADRPGGRWTGHVVQRLRGDPHRAPSALFLGIASYVQPRDIVIDVGGRAGRHGLPLALRCKEVINVDPSPAMLARFKASAAEAGIANVQAIQSDWLSAAEIKGDIALVSSVTYFVPDIVPFIEKVAASARRRVIICMLRLPNPNDFAPYYESLHGKALPPVPGYREILPVLWEMGILPEIRIFPFDMHNEVLPDRGAAFKRVLTTAQFRGVDEARARTVLEEHFDELFAPITGGFTLRSNLDNREILVTWDTS